MLHTLLDALHTQLSRQLRLGMTVPAAVTRLSALLVLLVLLLTLTL
jgi:hypothetical protein